MPRAVFDVNHLFKAQMAVEVAAREAAEEQVKNVRKRKTETKKIIPKPKGTCGCDYKLREAMGWGSKANEDPMKKRRYLDCLVSSTHVHSNTLLPFSSGSCS